MLPIPPIACSLRCESLENPLGLDVAQPRFSWHVVAQRRGAAQAAYQVLVASSPDRLQPGVADKWDSGRVEAADSNLVTYAGLPLASRERCWWTVRTWDDTGGVSPFADSANFEMALLTPEDWTARWIGADNAIANGPLFRKEFLVRDALLRARVYIVGLGYYELRLNGAKVGDHVLDPNWTNFDRREMHDLLYPFDDQSTQRVHYVTYDVTTALRAGANALGVMLGNGWYNQRGRTIEGKLWYDTPRLRLQLELEYADGHRETVVSDASWSCAAGPLVADNIFLGEVYDARREQPGWDLPGFGGSRWTPACEVRAPTGRLCAQLSPPDRVMAVLKPRQRTEPAPGVFVFDFGQNFSGWVRLRAAGPAGTAITLRFAEEILPDGHLDVLSAGGADQVQKDTFTLRGTGSAEQYEPRFTWHCFRYVEVTGYPGRPPLTALAGCVVHSDVPDTGAFACSEPLVNRMVELYRWTQLSSYHGCVPCDCPHRERLGYTGDGQLTVESALLAFGAASLYRQWLEDIADAQNHLTGFVPHTAPFYGGGGGPAWGSGYPIVAWMLYQYQGDRRVLEQHYAGMRQWLDYLGTRTDADGIVDREEPQSWCLGDWSTPGEPCVPGKAPLKPELVNTAYFAICAQLMARIATALGRPADSAAFTRQAEQTAAALHRRFFDPVRGRYGSGTNGSDAFAWAAGAIPPAELPRVTAGLLDDLAARDGHLDTGILGLPLELDFLAATGHADAAWRMLTRTTFPSFGFMLANGATTLWENWARENGSHCHPMYGSFVAWLYRVVAGICAVPEAPGFSAVRIQPRPVPGLAWVRAAVETPHGPLRVEWRFHGARFELQTQIPVGCAATVHLPVRSPHDAVVREGRHVLWRRGTRPARLPQGVTAVRAETGDVCVETGSGVYRFSLA